MSQSKTASFSRTGLWLTLVFWAAVAWSAVRPYQWTDYLLEIATPVGGFVLLAATRRLFPWTRLSYLLFLAEGLILVVGAHYTHEHVPLFDWIKDTFDLSRNHYDRFAHFCVGLFLVIPAREILTRGPLLRGSWRWALSVVSILALAGFYEITEWWIAVLASPETGAAYLGSQGDPWDAQKDMLLDTLGAIVGLTAFSRTHDRGLEKLTLSC